MLAGLGLRPADVATQVVFRDGIAEWVSVLAQHRDQLAGPRDEQLARLGQLECQRGVEQVG